MMSKAQLYDVIMQAVYEICNRVACENATSLEAKTRIAQSITKSAVNNTEGRVFLSCCEEDDEEDVWQSIELAVAVEEGDEIRVADVWIHWRAGDLRYASDVFDCHTNCSIVLANEDGKMYVCGNEEPKEWPGEGTAGVDLYGVDPERDSQLFFEAVDEIWL